VARLRNGLLPLIDRFRRMARESIEAIRRMKQSPAAAVERAQAIEVVVVPVASDLPPAGPPSRFNGSRRPAERARVG